MILNINQIKFKKIRNLGNFLASQSNLTDIEDNFIFGNKINDTASMFSDCYNLTTVPNFDTSNVINMSSMFAYCGEKLTTVPNFNTSNVLNMAYMFGGSQFLTDVPNFNTINVINMSSMFEHCLILTKTPNFNTSNVIDMSYMFYYCYSLNTILNLNTNNVLYMNGMFYDCKSLTNVPNFNTSKVINMSNMFCECDNLINTPNLNTSNVQDMGYMFYECNRLANIYNYNISNVVTMTYMFQYCNNLKNLPLFDSISNAQTDMSDMFNDCPNLIEATNNAVVNLFNQAYNMQNMFTNCNNLTQSSINNIIYYLPNTNNLEPVSDYPLSYLGFSEDQIKLAISNINACNKAINNGWNIQTTTNYNVLYKTDVNATEWTAMPLNNVIISNNAWAINNCFNANTPNKNTITNLKVNNLPGVTNLFNKFSNLSKLKNVEELNIPEVEDIDRIFSNCINLTIISNFNTNNIIKTNMMFYNCYNLTTISNFNTSKVINMRQMFQQCNHLTAIPNFNTSNVTDMGWMFSHCNNLTNIPNFDTSNVTDMTYMISYCGHLTTIPNFNTINVTNMADMFCFCYNLTTVSNFNTSNVFDMGSIFSYCYNLTTIPNFDTSNVAIMRSAFVSAGLTTMPNFDTHNVEHMEYIFKDCHNLTIVPNFNTSSVISIENAFSDCYNLSLSSCENILYSIPYYNNITDVNKYPMINYFAKNSALTNNNMIANLNSAAIAAAEEKGWFVTPTLKIDYTLLNGTTGTNKISINGMNGLEQLSNLRNMIQSSYTWNQAKKLIISGTSENLELAELGWGYIGPSSLGSFFKNVSNLDFVGINTASATNGYEAFSQSNIINLNGLKTNSIINGARMFSVCYFLNIQWNSWNFSNLQNAYSMFDYCNLTNLPGVSSLMPNVTNMKSIFKNCSGITNNTMQNIVKIIPDYTQLVDDINPDNTLNYLGITNDQINMLSDDYKQMAADKHWNIPGFRAREKVSILPICNNLGAISNYSGTTNEYPMEVIYDDTYGDHFLQSKNQGKQSSNSSAVINFTNELVALCGNKYYMDIYYSCENNYDYLQIFKMNNGSSSWNKIGENKYTGYSGMNYLYSSLDLGNIQVGDQLRFTFSKDHSGDVGLDGCLISIYGYKTDGAYEITYSLVNEPEITKYKIIPKE